MKMRVMGLLMVAGAASAASAQEVKATKKSAGQQVSDNLYGNVETRVQTYSFQDADNDTQRTRDFVLRPKLGTKLLSEKLDLNFTMPVVNKQQSAKSSQERPEVETTLNVYDSSRLTVDLYALQFIANGTSKYDGYADLDITFKRDFDSLKFGKIETSFLVEPEANLTTSNQDAKVSRRERPDGTTLALTGEGQSAPKDPEQKETSKALNFYPKVAVSPSAVAGLKLSLGSILANTYKPKYVAITDQNGESTLKNDGYEVSRATQVRYTVSYQIREGLSVYNQLRQNLNGYFEAGPAAKDTGLDNRTGIILDLF